MTAGARLLGDANVSAVAWAGTAGSWLGLGHDRERGIDPGRPDHALYRVRSGPDHRHVHCEGPIVAAESHLGLTVNHSFATVAAVQAGHAGHIRQASQEHEARYVRPSRR
jgi:hypothetical protein